MSQPFVQSELFFSGNCTKCIALYQAALVDSEYGRTRYCTKPPNALWHATHKYAACRLMRLCMGGNRSFPAVIQCLAR